MPARAKHNNSNLMSFVRLNGTRCHKMVAAAANKNVIFKLLRSAGTAILALPDDWRILQQSGRARSHPRNFCTKTTIGFRQQMDHTVPPKEYKWMPNNLISENFRLGPNGHVCIVLNRRIQVPAHVVKRLWKNAILRCTVDGGSNHWRNFVVSQAQQAALRQTEQTMSDSDNDTTPVAELVEPPDLITGDFDSITEETIEFFKSTPKINTPDQDATDFTKAFTVLQPVMVQRKVKDVVVFHDCSGRLDQVMANLNTLYKMQKDNCNVYLLSGDSITWLLRPGKHTIQIPLDLVTNQRWCSLIPVGSPAHNVTTTGLKWNLYHAQLDFGGMVSTSNTYSTEFVQVQTDGNLIWSMGAYDFEEKPQSSVK
ncbi:thiamin pyrophosphokinase 1 [Drosophila sulfurigaster albostrigata]|uniref:thiamin pyrophosphokinase 1 n=1 Tax=Drosophila sulfurigaster albostrigata TaxID=89887 RepID=UPI002D219A8D|nr:thiamin pyrophosphokinase 1 [Drosophila sulfurigaster albostrigata]